MTIKVHGGWETKDVADFSPFCLKLKTYLRMTGIEYEQAMGDPRKGPTKHIPFIDDGGEVIGDSGLIFAHLKKKNGDKLDAKLTDAERALGHVVMRTVEESLYFVLLYERWSGEESWKEVEAMLRPLMPPVIGGLIAGSIRKGTLGRTFAQGVGRRAPEKIMEHGKADIDAVATLLGDKPYLLGSEPTSYDAAVYGAIANVLAFPRDGVLNKHARKHENLVKYAERIKSKYWADEKKAEKKPAKKTEEKSDSAEA